MRLRWETQEGKEGLSSGYRTLVRMDVTMTYSHVSEFCKVTARSKMFVATIRGDPFGSQRSLPPTMSIMHLFKVSCTDHVCRPSPVTKQGPLCVPLRQSRRTVCKLQSCIRQHLGNIELLPALISYCRPICDVISAIM